MVAVAQTVHRAKLVLRIETLSHLPETQPHTKRGSHTFRSLSELAISIESFIPLCLQRHGGGDVCIQIR